MYKKSNREKFKDYFILCSLLEGYMIQTNVGFVVVYTTLLHYIDAQINITNISQHT